MLTIQEGTEESAPYKTFLQEKIRAYNDEQSPQHAKKRRTAVRPVHVMVFEEEEIVGGIYGEIYWGWLEIEFLYLPDSLRAQGLGSQLLNQIETLARPSGVERVLVTTFSFQAYAFYEKHGYETTGVIPDYPPGFSHYTLVKHLVPSSGSA
ncbi:GNAT family N-acetyltransferase [Exiguobacterium antarcticum]|uniref:GNAT family N-acetyltransferase n=1 Tax=Exiguobacterium antarcticum TaxID=132920 RepID=A0ABT6R641_9BACL|nr:GNAT family N-acetyltransferase [Exiguobacterium antarcticum]AFS70566.1 Acetyltransferase, GNAT family domain protein [Exiguobacterium antarcticum B7]MDI3235751.1 GNAT family N-acetyltransferase [Exiguobacterium antarcticum]